MMVDWCDSGAHKGRPYGGCVGATLVVALSPIISTVPLY